MDVIYLYLTSCTLLCCHYSYSGYNYTFLSMSMGHNYISKCIFSGQNLIVAVEQTPFSGALEEDWLAPAIPSLTFVFSEL